MSTDVITPEMRKQLTTQHQLWLENPITQMVVSNIRNRLKHYDSSLIEGIRRESNKEKEENLRTAISTTKAILLLIGDSDKFIEHSTKQPPTE